MKRLKEKCAYQWQVLRWKGCACMSFFFVGILSAFFDAWFVADVAVETGDISTAFLALLCGVGGLIMTWCANWVWREYEKHYYKRAESGSDKDYE